MQSEKPIGRDEELDKIQKEIGSGFVYVKNRYYKPTEYSCYTYEVVDDKEKLLKREPNAQLYESVQSA
jgi:hypothetical protein